MPRIFNMSKNRILLIGGNFYPEPTGIGKYNGEMIEWLAKEGHSCTVVTTFPYYPQWKVQEPYAGKRSFWFESEKIYKTGSQSINIIRCPHFVPVIPSGLNRLISEFSFFFSAYLIILLLLFKKKYDYIINVAPPFETGLLGMIYKIFRGGKLLYHIQDLQVDAAHDMGIIKSKRIINLFFYLERLILNHSEFISTISSGMMERVKTKCNKEIAFFPNWVDVNAFYPVVNKAELKIKYGFSPSDTTILYSGAIGHKQGLEAILHTAKALESFTNIKFAICGSGPYRQNLINMQKKMNLNNVTFLPLQPLNSFNSFLNMADIHLVLQKGEASDLYLPSKLCTILSVGGVAIVTARLGTSLYDIVSTHNLGILMEPENQDALTTTVINIPQITTELALKSKNAREYAVNNLATNRILEGFFSKMFLTRE
ncbi:MAG: WcaI family glycosyltransferase [Chitinophagaceae bacterium]